ncbi:hypothetical protein SAMN05192553_10955 [Cyclobacterium xiamenense]|uniref:META domain-containing protein n=1 Tax=Cyclobacterium xiamenense TaxID=1297121 RepID=A0A1H7AZN7_9BACT|nr:hypothetical protein [Cyclobacterium xiamenense]SEJ71063.1 hypothetical protein SAMN05192553_10955 [Cyclobacterium xiamenense]
MEPQVTLGYYSDRMTAAKKTYIPFLWILLAGAGTLACVESHQAAPVPRVSLAASTWRLQPYQPESPAGELLKRPSYALEFLNDSTFLFRLDGALVHGRYAYDLERNSMQFRELAWVKNGCCASDYSHALVEALQAVSKGFLEKSHLRLRGEKTEMRFKPMYL